MSMGLIDRSDGFFSFFLYFWVTAGLTLTMSENRIFIFQNVLSIQLFGYHDFPVNNIRNRIVIESIIKFFVHLIIFF